MGYKYTIDTYYRVKKDGEYPWPCGDEPNRKIELFTDDVLTVDEDGKYMKHTGLGCFGIILKKDQIELVTKPVHLQMM